MTEQYDEEKRIQSILSVVWEDIRQAAEKDIRDMLARARSDRRTFDRMADFIDTAKLAEIYLAAEGDIACGGHLVDEGMKRYRKARAWDAFVCAAKIRALKNAAPQAGEPQECLSESQHCRKNNPAGTYLMCRCAP